MKVKELIERLKEYDPEMEVAILDGFNGGGQPRALNFGPTNWDSETLGEMDDFDMSPDYSDLSVPEGTEIIVMGYGCY
jgi:hypothetical protein